jgi:hypothetical protein
MSEPFENLPEIQGVTTPGAVKELPAIVSATQFMAVEIPAPAELIHGLVHKGSKVSLSGTSKGCKTWTLIDAGISVATGADFLVCKTESGRVLYVNLEVQAPFFQRRLQKVADAKGVSLNDNLDVWNLRGHAAPLWKILPQMQERIDAVGYSLLVFDPIYKLYGTAKENEAGDIAKLLNDIETLSVSSGAAIAFGAHYSKGNQAAKDAIDRTSGSGVFARDPDSIISMTKHEEDGAYTVEATLRNFAPIEPFVVRWEFPLMRRDESLDPAKLKQAKGRTKTHTEHDILSLLPKSGLTATDWQENADTEYGIKRSTFFSLKRSLDSSKKITLDRISNKWRPL